MARSLTTKYASISIVFLCSLLALSNVSAGIYACKDSTGKTIFSDDRRNCVSDIAEVAVKTSKDSRVNYRYPAREYVQLASPNYKLFTEAPESEKDREQLQLASARLTAILDAIFEAIPADSHDYLKSLDFYIMIGPRSRLGGEDNGLRYYTKNGDIKLMLGDKRWAHSVVIFSVENFLWISDLWAKKAVMHELAHAWHYKDWGRNYPILKQAWLAARHKGLYLSQQDVDGKLVQPAYASTNEREYFAELSAMYFVGGNYYPFEREKLKEYDPTGFAMVETVWGL